MPMAWAYCWVVARVDPGDDSIERFIVRHYRYDPQRRERRHVVVAVFGNEREFQACVEGVFRRRSRAAGMPGTRSIRASTRRELCMSRGICGVQRTGTW